jgi:HSP20 family protein
MALLKRGERPEWPDLFFARTPFEWPERWPHPFEGNPLKVEEFRDGDAMVIRLEAPGIDPDKDVEITLAGDSLQISVERRQETKEEQTWGFRSEFRYGSFVRSVGVPTGTKVEDVAASYRDGILEVRLPVDTEQSGARKVPITRG